MRLTFWSRARNDAPQAVVSHITALVLHELTDLLPESLHLTVPPRFEKRSPRGVILHRATLAARDVEERDGFRVTTPLRTLFDASGSPDVPRAELVRAVETALDRGMVRRSVLLRASRETPNAARLASILGRSRRKSA